MEKTENKKIKKLLDTQDAITDIISERIKRIKNADAIKELEKDDFGTLKYVFESIMPKLYENAKAKKLLGKYTKTIKENKNLKNNYRITNLLKETTNVENGSVYLESVLKLKKQINEADIKSLRDVVVECVSKLNVTSDELDAIKNDYKKTVDSSISYILNENVNLRNVKEHSDNTNKVITHIENNKSEINENVSKGNCKELIEEYNELITEGIEDTPWMKELFTDIFYNNLRGDTMENLFEDYKTSCVKILDENIDRSTAEESSRFVIMKEQLSNKNFSSETISEDIVKLAELKYTLNS